VGATLFGLLCTFLIETIHKKGNLQADATMGMVFTLLFAIGVILISAFTHSVDIDQECVLYGEITFITLDTWMEIPRSTWILGSAFLIVMALIVVGYKGLFLTTFDPSYALSLGISTALWHYVLMGAVSFTSVVSFESVGAILVVAFLVAPAAIAYLLTDNFKMMMLLASVAGIVSAIGGYYLAVAINGSIAGAMTAVLGGEFLLVLLFSPSHGLLGKVVRKSVNFQDLQPQKS
jgi:manganese/zinc/iron transport system permease protein